MYGLQFISIGCSGRFYFGLYSRLMRMSGHWLSERSCGPLFVKLVVKIGGFIIMEVIQDQAINFLKIVFR